MAFLPYSYDHGQPMPSEYRAVEAGDVTVGLCMRMSQGRLKLSTQPDYIALCDKAGAEKGTVIPAMHITGDMLFEAPLSQDAASMQPGDLADVAADGLSIAPTKKIGNIQIVAMDGVAAGALCRCRFVETKEV
jgi:hypothetical protein